MSDKKRGSHLKGIERNSCATCIFIELDPKWEIKNLCRKHVKNQKWVKVPK